MNTNTETITHNETGTLARAPRYRAVSEHLGCDLNGETVILNLKNGKYYGLNLVGTRIWETIQNPASPDEIEAALLAEFDVGVDVCREEVRSFLSSMADEGLVEIIDEQVPEISKAAPRRKDTLW